MSIITSTHGQLVINGKAVRDRDAMLASIAPDFSPSTPYEAGEYVIHDSEIRKFKEGGHAAGAWSDSDNDPATIDDVIGELSNAIEEKDVDVPEGTKLCQMPGLVDQIGGGGGMVKLPPTGYTRLLYVGNTGYAWLAIDRNFSGMGVDLLFTTNQQTTSGAGGRAILRALTNDVGGSGISITSSQLDIFSYSYQWYTVNIKTSTPNEKQIFVSYRQHGTAGVTGSVKVDTSTYNINLGATGVDNNYSLCVFRPWKNASDTNRVNIMFANIYDVDDQLVFELVPCRDDSTGNVGFYDFVQNSFYALNNQADVVAGAPFVFA